MIFALPAAAIAATAEAGRPATASIAWQCTQESDASFHVLCAPRQVDADAPPPPPAPATMVTTTGGTPYADMRPVAQRGDPEVFSAPAWRVPLHSRPTDPDLVQQLLKSVLCGNHAACSVSYDNTRLRVAAR